MPAQRHMAVAALALVAVAPLGACDGGGDDPAPSTVSSPPGSTPAGDRSEGAATGSTRAAAASTTVKRDELEKDMLAKLRQNGSGIASVECPGTVEATVGARTTCTVKADDGRVKDYEVTVTAVNGTDVGYSANPK